MAVVTSRTVRINVIVNERDATASLDRTGTSANRASGRLGAFGNVIATLRKALISMVGVLIAFNLFIKLPELIITGIGRAFLFSLNAVSEFQQGLLSIKAILSSTLEFSTDAIKNFQLAGRAAVAVNDALIREAARTPATLEQLRQGFQALIGGGGLGFVKNLREAVKLNTLLVNSTLALTVGQDASRQIATEIRAVITGQVTAGSQLARFIGANTERFKAQLEVAKKLGTTFEFFSNLLKGFDLAATAFGNTLQGIKTSFLLIAQIVGREIIGPFVDRLVPAAISIRDRQDEILKSLRPIITLIGGILVVAFDRILKALKDSKITVKDVEKTILSIVAELAEAFALAKNLFSTLKPAFVAIAAVVGTIVTGFIVGVSALIDIIPRIIKAPLNILKTEIQAILDLIQGNFASAGKRLASLVSFDTLFGTDLQERLLKITLTGQERIQKLANLVKDTTLDGINLVDERQFRENIINELFIARIGIAKRLNELDKESADILSKKLKTRFGDFQATEAQTKLLRQAISLQKLIPVTIPELQIGNLIQKFKKGGEEGSDEAINAIIQKFKRLPELLKEAGIIQGIIPVAAAILQPDALVDIFRQFGSRAVQSIIDVIFRQRADVVKSLRELGEKGFDAIGKSAQILSRKLSAELKTADANLKSIQDKIEAIKRLEDARAFRVQAEERLRRFRLQAEGAIQPGVAPIRITELIRDIQMSETIIAKLENRMKELRALFQKGIITQKNVDEFINAAREAENLRTSVAATSTEIANMIQNSATLADVLEKQLINAIVRVASSAGGQKGITGVFRTLIVQLKAVKEQIAIAIGQGIAELISNLIMGGEGIGKIFGRLLIQLGNIAIALGSIIVLAALIPFFGALFGGKVGIGVGLALIALGIGLIAFGTAIGGSGRTLKGGQGGGSTSQEKTREFAFNEALISVQQATSDLTNAIKTLRGIPAGAVVIKGLDEKGGATKVLVKDAAKSSSLTASVMMGKIAMGEV